MKKYLVIIMLAGLAHASTAGKNLIKNGDFEKGSTRWGGDKNIVYETEAKTNRICKIEVGEEQKYEFYQKINTSNVDYLNVRFRIKKSPDYDGKGYMISFRRGDGSGQGAGKSLPANNDWNIVEFKSLDYVHGESNLKVVFTVMGAESGSLSFDDIEIVEDTEFYQ